MLLKYLNELDAAVANVRTHPDSVHVKRCVECAAVLENYLKDQMEPVRLKGEEIMRQIWPQDFTQLPGMGAPVFTSARH